MVASEWASALLAGFLAAPVVMEKHEIPACGMVEITRTNMGLGDASEALSVYLNVIESVGINGSAVSERLSITFGGFWDIYLMGSAFSYSVYCVSYIELAGSEWNVLLCSESADADATDCGGDNLALHSNGTIDYTRQAEGLRLQPRLDMYANFYASWAIPSMGSNQQQVRTTLDAGGRDAACANPACFLRSSRAR